MSKAPRLSLSPPHEAPDPHLEVRLPVQEGRNRNWRLLRPKLVEAMVAVIDFLLIVLAGVGFSSVYYLLTDGDVEHVLPYAGMALIVAVNFVTIMTARQNYHLKGLLLVARQVRETIVIWSGIFALLAAVAFTMKVGSNFSRGAVILFSTGGLGALLCWRQMVARFISRSLSNGLFAKKRVLVIAEQGKSSSSGPLKELLSYGFAPVRIYEISKEEISSPGMPRSLRSKLAEMIEFARGEQIEHVYLLMQWRNDRAIDGILDALAVLPVTVHLIPDENAARFLRYPAANVGGTWTALLRRAPLTKFELATKRCFDIGLTAIGLLIMAPLMLITAALIKLDSRGPIFFRQRRNGFNGQTFNIFKFRTMYVLEDNAAIRQATRNDTRVTRLGRFLRKTSVDELPQLFNVILGDMSLVGPRPHAISHNSEYEKLIANYAFRHHVQPGLTGWAQVNGYRGETRQIEQMQQRVEHDLWYINNWSFWLDFKVVLRTLGVAFWQDGAY